MRSLIHVAIVFAVAAACGGGGQPAPTGAASPGAGATVRYKDLRIDPTAVTVTRGQSVTWTNADGTAHTVTAGTPGAKSGKFEQRLAGNASATIRFDEAGTFEYFCEFHTTMRGRVVVN